MKKLLIAVAVVCALPALAAPPHQKPGLVHQEHASSAFDRGMRDHASDTRAQRTTSSARNTATQSSKLSATGDNGR